MSAANGHYGSSENGIEVIGGVKAYVDNGVMAKYGVKRPGGMALAAAPHGEIMAKAAWRRKCAHR
jgi:hypothetical protein